MTLLVDTQTVAPHQRFDYWADASCRLFHPLELRQTAGRRFWGTLSGQTLGHLEVFRLAAAVARRIFDLRADLGERLALPGHRTWCEVPFVMARHAAGIEVRGAVAR